MPEARANGVSLYYEEHGAGEPIVGLHGAGSRGGAGNRDRAQLRRARWRSTLALPHRPRPPVVLAFVDEVLARA